MRRGGPLVYVVLLIGVTAVWGWTFVVVKVAISEYPPLPFLAVRFAIALIAVLILVWARPTCAILGHEVVTARAAKLESSPWQ